VFVENVDVPDATSAPNAAVPIDHATLVGVSPECCHNPTVAESSVVALATENEFVTASSVMFQPLNVPLIGPLSYTMELA
jgi:hypothetical protein